MEPSKNRVVYIKWRDTVSYSGWFPPDEKLESTLVESVGFLIEENKEDVTISNSLSDMDHMVDPLVIPRRTIVSIDFVSIRKERKKK